MAFQKKKLLFVIDSLSIGGAEKSLVTLLNLIDYSKYTVDLQLFSQGGPFQSLLPKEVNLLPVPDYFAYASTGWNRLPRKLGSPKKLLAQLRYSAELRIIRANHTEKAVLFWKACGDCIEGHSDTYDVAIAYAQGVPTFYVADKVTANKKLAWINVTYQPTGEALEYIKPYYSKFDVVNAVSESVRKQLQETFSVPEAKVMLMKDILDVGLANKMASMATDAKTEMAFDGTRILTVGRLANMKGYDLAIEAAKILQDSGLRFKWFAVGEGPMRESLTRKIKEYNLESSFVLLGGKTNPYPYFAECDLYVQPSRFEGFGITLAEAKMFRKPIVTTNFDAVGAQFVNEENGLIVDISPAGIAEGIKRMLADERLREKCIANVSKETIGNREEIDKLDSLFNECL